MYLFFGGISFFLNIGIYIAIDKKFRINELANNVICWVICVWFQFFTNRIWVFEDHVKTTKALVKQVVAFWSGRVITLLVEETILVMFIVWMGFDSVFVKFGAQIIVILLNYIISKWVVFKKAS